MITIRRTNKGFEEFVKSLQDKKQSYNEIGNTSISIKSDAEYSGYVDQGTRYMSAQPFFQGTIEAHSLEEIGPEPTKEKIRQYAYRIAGEMESKAPVDTGNLVSQIHVEE